MKKPSKPVKKTSVAAKAGRTAASKAKAKPTAKPKPAAKTQAKKKAAPAKPAPKGKTEKKAAASGSPAKAAAKPAPKAPVKGAPKPEAKVDPRSAKAKSDPKAKEAAAKASAADAFPALDPNVKRPAKPFFLEVKQGVERVIKRGDKSAVSQVIDLQARRKGPAAEETPEELAERIERELQSQSFLKRAPMRPQMCTKCGINAVTPRFTIDRELGYCEICAEILHLGETKEAKRMEFNLSVKKEEVGEAAEADEVPPEEAEEEPVPEDLDD